MFHVKHLFKKRRRGLALGGGGVRALSSVGVLKHFDSNSIEFNCIAGTSMGAVVGALYCYYRSAELVEKKFRQIYEGVLFSKLKQEFSSRLKPMGTGDKSIKDTLTAYYSRMMFFKNIFTETFLISRENVTALIDEIIPDIDIENLPLEFCCVATDITRGRKKVFRSGPLKRAIMSTIAIPGILAPVKEDGIMYTDGGSVSMTPVEELGEMGADLKVAVEVFSCLPYRKNFDKGMEILERCSKITSFELHKRQLSGADVVISPAVKDLVWSDFNSFDYAIAAGETAAFGTEKAVRKF